LRKIILWGYRLTNRVFSRTSQTLDYRPAASYETTGGVKTIEEVKGELAGESQQEESGSGQTEEKGIKGFWNKLTNKNKNTATSQNAKSGVKNKSSVKGSVKNKGKEKVSSKAKPVVATKKTTAKKTVVSGKTKSAASKLTDSKSIKDQLKDGNGGYQPGSYHHF
jgi:hypothetical protein